MMTATIFVGFLFSFGFSEKGFAVYNGVCETKSLEKDEQFRIRWLRIQNNVNELNQVHNMEA